MTEEERKNVVAYRIESAHKTMSEIPVHIANGFYNTAINRMYYACYYIASALLISNKISTQTHEGVKLMLGKEFVLSGKLSSEQGKFYSKIFDRRISGDYEDFFNNTKEVVDEYLPQVEAFIKEVEALIKK